MPPRQALVAPVWTGEGTRRFGGSAESFWQRTLAYSSEEVAAFLGKQLQRAPTNPSQTQLAAAGWPGGAFKRTLARKLPAPDEPTPADTAGEVTTLCLQRARRRRRTGWRWRFKALF